jgi:hypothetical protein
MADELWADIDRYKTLWSDIAEDKFTKELPILDKPSWVSKLTQEVQESFGDKSNMAGKYVAKHLDKVHEVTDQLHYLRDIADATENPLLLLRGLHRW